MKELIFVLILPLISLAQINYSIGNKTELFPFYIVQDDYNHISKSAYDNIRVNNVLLKNIINFQGGVDDIEALLGVPFSVHIPDPEARNFYNNSVKLVYGESTANRVLYYLEILNSDIPLHMMGKEIRLGSNISVMGLGTNLKSKAISLTNRSAVFVSDYNDSFIAIEFDARTNVIVKIEYISPT